jgi:hypothetical protein
MVDLTIVICNRVAGASITTYHAVGMFIIANHVAKTPIVAVGMSIIPDGSIIPGRAVGTPIESQLSADGANGAADSHPWVYIVASQHRTACRSLVQLLSLVPISSTRKWSAVVRSDRGMVTSVQHWCLELSHSPERARARGCIPATMA